MSSGSPFIQCMRRVEHLREHAAEAAEQRARQAASSSQNRLRDAVSNQSDANVTAEVGSNSQAVLSPSPIIKKRTQNVWTICQRVKVIQWMKKTVEEQGEKNIASKAVKNFPLLFRTSLNADIRRAVRLWADRNKYEGENGDVITVGSTSCIRRNTTNGMKQVRLKAGTGRGRKRAAWVEALHIELREEFDRLRRVGVKFNLNTLRLLAKSIHANVENPTYGPSHVDERSGKFQKDMIDPRWIQTFCDRFRIVSRTQTGKLKVSPEKTIALEKDVSRHLGILKRGFENGDFDEKLMSNADETHFIFNMDNGRTLGLTADEEVKYADVTSGSEGMTMLVRLSGGPKAIIETPLIIFKNKSRSYPIRNLPDNIPGVAYRTGPKGWMDSSNMLEWLKERRVMKELPGNKIRELFIDNCSGHNLNEEIVEAAEQIKTNIHYFPPNTTEFIQPCDALVIQMIKTAWKKRWDSYKLGLIQANAWEKNGKLPNPGKAFFLRLAADSVRDVNKLRNTDGITYARKAMIICGMALNINGKWEEGQLKPELQNIIKKHRDEFEQPDLA